MRKRLVSLRRVLGLTVVLALTLVAVPNSQVSTPDAYLVKVNTADAIAHNANVVWILFLGSDARPGETFTGTRSDAIHLVGINLKTGSVASLGIPRDSWVPIPGCCTTKINAAMVYGGPQMMAKAVSNLVGITPDYVFVTSFWGFKDLIKTIGNVTVISPNTWSDPFLHANFKAGKTVLNPQNALRFARSRHGLPRGDFDRSGDQNLLLLGILKQVLKQKDKPGFMERAVLAGMKDLYLDKMSPTDLYKLAQLVTLANPKKAKMCVLNGTTGMVGSASVVHPDIAEAHAFAKDTMNDAKINYAC